MDRNILKFFFDCGDDQIIQFAMMRAHLNRLEKDVIVLMMDECLSQEQVAERIGYSVRRTQDIWYSGADKLLSIPWVLAFAKELKSKI